MGGTMSVFIAAGDTGGMQSYADGCGGGCPLQTGNTYLGGDGYGDGFGNGYGSATAAGYGESDAEPERFIDIDTPTYREEGLCRVCLR